MARSACSTIQVQLHSAASIEMLVTTTGSSMNGAATNPYDDLNKIGIPLINHVIVAATTGAIVKGAKGNRS